MEYCVAVTKKEREKTFYMMTREKSPRYNVKEKKSGSKRAYTEDNFSVEN